MASSQNNTSDFMQEARERFRLAADAESHLRKEAAIDLRFVAGDQWDPEIREARRKAGKPTLTFNSLPTFEQQVSNEARQNKPSIKFSPVDNGADIDTAKVFEGIARHIQYASKADVAYEIALQYSVSGSFGYFRLLTDYVHEKSNDQEVRFAPVMDPMSVYGALIPACYRQKPQYVFVVEKLQKVDYEKKYGDAAPLNWDEASATAPQWITDNEVTIAEYWRIETVRRALETWTRISADESGNPVEQHVNRFSDDEEEIEEGFQLNENVRPRIVYQDRVKTCKINGVGVIPDTETEWPGKCIPIFVVLGSQKIVDGKPRLFSLVRNMRDPQNLINVYKTGIAEAISLGNKAPYIGFKGQFTDPKWQNANLVNYAFLEAEPVLVDGRIAPLPQRSQFEAAIQSLSVAAAQEIDDLKRVVGIFDSSLGSEGNEKSGIAIQRRQAQSSITNLHFIDNLKRAQEEAGCELGYVIPAIYDTEREVRIVGEDDAEQVIKVNGPYKDPKTGEVKTYMLDAGRYDVTVSSGPSYATKRQESFDFLAQLTQANPNIMEIAGDEMFRNSDAAGADALADRMKKYIGMKLPGLIEEEGKPKPDPKMQAQLAQYEQMIDALTSQLNGLAEEQKAKKLELETQIKIKSDELEFKREELKAKTTVELAKLDHAAGVEQLWAEIEALKSRFQVEASQQQADADRQHAVEMQTADQSHAADMKVADQAHQAQMTDADRQFQAEQQAAAQEQAAEEPQVSE